jgi:hypothetical protein
MDSEIDHSVERTALLMWLSSSPSTTDVQQWYVLPQADRITWLAKAGDAISFGRQMQPLDG